MVVSEDPIHRANRWASFYHEDGGLKEILDTLKGAYLDRAADLMPGDTAGLLKLGMGRKIVDQIDSHIQHIFTAGKIEQAAQDHADKIARLPEARRRFL
jgi:hypothetical protein